MAKKGLLLFISIGLVALAFTLFMMFFVLYPPAKVGEVQVSAGGTTIVPFSNELLYNTRGKKEARSARKLAEIWEELPKLHVADEFSIVYTESTYDDFAFTLYDKALKPVYSDSKAYTAPKNPGTYAVRVKFSWGKAKNDYITTEHFFKMDYHTNS